MPRDPRGTASLTLDPGMESIDITGAQVVEVETDGKTLWVNAPLCRLRACRFDTLIIKDNRGVTDQLVNILNRVGGLTPSNRILQDIYDKLTPEALDVIRRLNMEMLP